MEDLFDALVMLVIVGGLLAYIFRYTKKRLARILAGESTGDRGKRSSLVVPCGGDFEKIRARIDRFLTDEGFCTQSYNGETVYRKFGDRGILFGKPPQFIKISSEPTGVLIEAFWVGIANQYKYFKEMHVSRFSGHKDLRNAVNNLINMVEDYDNSGGRDDFVSDEAERFGQTKRPDKLKNMRKIKSPLKGEGTLKVRLAPLVAFAAAFVIYFLAALFGPDEGLVRSEESIDLVVMQNMAFLEHAYNVRLREKPDLNGEILVTFDIDEFGEVVSAEIAESTMDDPALEQIVAESVKSLRFDKIDEPGHITRVTYPFTFPFTLPQQADDRSPPRR